MDARSGDTLLGQRLDEYRLDTLLGQGGMARVYRGVDVHLERYVAIKVIDAPFRSDPEYIRRFEREAQAIARLDHPNIVTLYRYGEAQGLLYMAMQYVEGTDLSKVLKNYRDDGEYIDPGDAVRIVREVCAALDYAHAHGVIHRDVKPSNILLDQQGVVHLTDFGLALLEELGTRGDVFGTPHYIAPEQAVSSSAVVPQSDFYAVGVILYEMFTGQIPFDADTPMDIAVKHMTEPVVPPGEIRPEINPELESVIFKALSKSAEDRYDTGAALAGAVDQAVRRGAGERRPLSVTPRPTRSLPDLVSVAMAENPLPPVDSVVSTPLGRGADQTPAPATPRTAQTATPGIQPPQRAPDQRRHPARLPLFAGLTATGFLLVFIVAIVVTLSSGGEPPAAALRSTSRNSPRRILSRR
ncbi:MAG: protein kinase [Anaerolineae bacterium]|nr:protein kinase [Anaerolineae bacterium]